MSDQQQGFVVGKADAGMKTLTRITEVVPYLAEYVDGQGAKQVRVVFDVPGADAVFVMTPRAGGAEIMNPATGWFKKAVKDALDQPTDADEDEAESI